MENEMANFMRHCKPLSRVSFAYVDQNAVPGPAAMLTITEEFA
jgi:hypothetical protein